MSDELALWRRTFELRDGVLHWRTDPSRGKVWNAQWAGKAAGKKRVPVGGRIVRGRTVAEALRTGRIDGRRAFDYGGGLPDHVEVGQGPLATAIREAAIGEGLRPADLSVLSRHVDPFLLDTPRGHAEGRWFAEHFESRVGERRIHLRGFHYVLVSVASILKPRGPVYVNSQDDWQWLVNRAAKCARWLGYIPFGAIDDSRNEEPRYHRIIAGASPQVTARGGLYVDDLDVDDAMPAVSLGGFTPQQKYLFAMFGEKSSLAPVVDRRAIRYGADLYIGAGELSDTLIHDIAKRAVEDGRILICFTVCDFDPSGRQMTTSISRKLRALKTLLFPDLEYRVREIGLTLEQATRYDLPSTPLKPTEARAANWVGRFGREQTEIDALLALRPGVLEQEVDRAFAPFFDRTLLACADIASVRWRAAAQGELEAQIGEARIEGWRERYGAALAEIEAVNAEQDEALSGFAFDAPELPEVEIDDPDGGDVASSAMTLAEESLALKARKAFEDGDSEDADG